MKVLRLTDEQIVKVVKKAITTLGLEDATAVNVADLILGRCEALDKENGIHWGEVLGKLGVESKVGDLSDKGGES